MKYILLSLVWLKLLYVDTLTYLFSKQSWRVVRSDSNAMFAMWCIEEEVNFELVFFWLLIFLLAVTNLTCLYKIVSQLIK